MNLFKNRYCILRTVIVSIIVIFGVIGVSKTLFTDEYPNYITALENRRVIHPEMGESMDYELYYSRSGFLMKLSMVVLQPDAAQPFFRLKNTEKYRNSGNNKRLKLREETLIDVTEDIIDTQGRYPSELFLKYWMSEEKPDFVPDIVNINTAGKADLQKLHGIGPAKSEKIIKFREIQEFTRPRDVMFVEGIAEKTFLKNLYSISIEPVTASVMCDKYLKASNYWNEKWIEEAERLMKE